MQFVETAVETASKSFGYYKHGALLVRNGNIVSWGVNDSSTHAEVKAIKNMYRVLWAKVG